MALQLRYVVRHESQLGEAIHLLHDRWFDLDAVGLKEDEQKLVLPFWNRATMRPPRDHATHEPPTFDRQLVIHSAVGYTVDDSERIGTYSLNKVDYVDGAVNVTAEPHLRIAVRVRELNFVIEDYVDSRRPT